jgi:hypothetical protein
MKKTGKCVSSLIGIVWATGDALFKFIIPHVTVAVASVVLFVSALNCNVFKYTGVLMY